MIIMIIIVIIMLTHYNQQQREVKQRTPLHLCLKQEMFAILARLQLFLFVLMPLHRIHTLSRSPTYSGKLVQLSVTYSFSSIHL